MQDLAKVLLLALVYCYVFSFDPLNENVWAPLLCKS